MQNTSIAQKPKFSAAISTESYQRLIRSTLGDPERAKRFVASISSAVATNPALQECDAGSVLSAALLGESLNLSPSPQLGMYYLVPYDDRKAGVKKAQFQLGYIGLKQLAQNTGLYRLINVVSVKKGELVKYDPFTGRHEFAPIIDPVERAAAETVGFYGCYELVNGYREDTYWTKEEMLRHADRYSKAFKLSDHIAIEKGGVKQSDMWKYSSPWYTNFEAMCHKTIIRQLLKTAPKSAEMRHALETDDKVISRDLAPELEDDVPFDASDLQGAVETALEGMEVDPGTGEVVEASGSGGEAPQMSLAEV